MNFQVADFRRWVLRTPTGVGSLELQTTSTSFSLGPRDVLVRIRAASLNPRDLAIINVSALHSDELQDTNRQQGLGKVD